MIRRTLSARALLFASISAILGSGWLFSAYYASQLAGPAAILSWIIGGAAIIFIAFVFAELSAMLPIMGSSTRIPLFTHGNVVSFIFSWVIWLSYMSLAPTEVQAIIQYIAFYYPNLVHTSGGLTNDGYITATALMIIISGINIFSLRWLIRCNNSLTIIKIIIPVLLSAAILHKHLHIANVIHPGHSPFYAGGSHGLLAAIASGGIIFAFNGFKQACEMAGEAKNPKRALPLAIIGSIVICLIIYVFLQMAFLSAIQSNNLIHGWSHLQFNKGISPFADLAAQMHTSYLYPIIYIGALIGPLAAALMYASSASRSLYATSKNGYLPRFFQHLTAQGNPWIAIVINFIFGMALFAPLPGWDRMISFLTSLMAITYSIAPICLLALRSQAPDQARPFKLPFATLWATSAFYVCTLITYWSGWYVISKLAIALLFGFLVLFIYQHIQKRKQGAALNWRSSIWMWVYIIGVTILSYLGNFGGGKNIIPFGWDFVSIAVFCCAVVYLAMKYKLPAEQTQAYLKKLPIESIT